MVFCLGSSFYRVLLLVCASRLEDGMNNISKPAFVVSIFLCAMIHHSRFRTIIEQKVKVEYHVDLSKTNLKKIILSQRCFVFMSSPNRTRVFLDFFEIRIKRLRIVENSKFMRMKDVTVIVFTCDTLVQ